MRTVYVVIKGGCVVEAYADHLTDLVVLDLDTQDEQMLDEVNATIKKLEDSRDIDVVEIY